MTSGREGSVTRGDETTSLSKTIRGQRSEKTTRDVGSSDDNCSDDSNGNNNGDSDSCNGDSSDNNSNSISGDSNSNSNSNSGGKNNNQLKPAAKKAATALDAALIPILLAS